VGEDVEGVALPQRLDRGRRGVGAGDLLVGGDGVRQRPDGVLDAVDRRRDVGRRDVDEGERLDER
jgi:hypothetical protein